MGWFGRNEHDEERLSAYLDGELDARQAESVERHLASCHSCTALMDELRDVHAMLSDLPELEPPRSFVLGPEYAEEPSRPAAAPPRRFTFAMAPAAALAVFVALVLVDVGNFSTSNDGALETVALRAMEREADADDLQAAGAASMAPPAMDAAEGPTTAGGVGAAPAEADGAGEAARTNDEEPSIANAGTLSTAEEPRPGIDPVIEPTQRESDDGAGLSTLRILQIVALVALLASGFYVFALPRFTRGGSQP